MTLSDIATGKGDLFTKKAYYGIEHSFRKSTWKWPAQAKPSRNEWRLWQRALCLIGSDNIRRSRISLLWAHGLGILIRSLYGSTALAPGLFSLRGTGAGCDTRSLKEPEPSWIGHTTAYMNMFSMLLIILNLRL